MIFVYALLALVITFVLVPVLIPTLKRMKFGQSIREEGPQSHMKKTGTNDGWTNISIKYCDNVFGGYYICRSS